MAATVQTLSYPCIAAHRGSCGGNIPPNTIVACEAALAQGASILEIDVARSADGVFYVFHTGNEGAYLGIDRPLEEMTGPELDSLRLRNEFRNPTQYGLDRLEDLLEHFKGRCVLNLDRCWQDWGELLPVIERHGMADQILLKSPCRKEWLDRAAELGGRYAYMPIISEDIRPFFDMGGGEIPGFVGAELVFSSEASPIITDKTVDRLHRMGKIAWGNGIQFSQAKVLSAGHTDDISILKGPEAGWGWLLDQGFDIVQTDWVGLLNQYLTKRDALS